MTYIGAALGAAYGAGLAWRRKGKKLDILHYGAAFGIIGALLGAIIGIAILRLS